MESASVWSELEAEFRVQSESGFDLDGMLVEIDMPKRAADAADRLAAMVANPDSPREAIDSMVKFTADAAILAREQPEPSRQWVITLSHNKEPRDPALRKTIFILFESLAARASSAAGVYRGSSLADACQAWLDEVQRRGTARSLFESSLESLYAASALTCHQIGSECRLAETGVSSRIAAVRQKVVRQILVKKRWSQARLADHAGVAESAVSDYLNGKTARVTPEVGKALAEALGLPNLPD